MNGRSPDTLNYEDFFNENNFGLTTIVIGGDKLSRGITLNTSTFRFTVPINGIYNVAAAVRMEEDFNFLYWRVVDYNGGSHLQAQTGKIVLTNGLGDNVTGGTNLTTACGSQILSLQTGKEYQINANTSPTSTKAVYADQTWLDVHLIG